MITHITTAYRQAFEALTSGAYDNFALLSCFVNGDPAAAIVAVHRKATEYLLTPLFVSVTDAMRLADHDGVPPGSYQRSKP